MQHGRNQDQSAEGDTHINQTPGETGATGCAIGLSGHKERACPAVVTCQEEADELRETVQISINAKELLRRFFILGVGEAGLDRVDKDDVRDIQPCKGVVFNDVRRRRQRAIREHRNTLGANRPKVQPDRAGTRATIERDQQRAVLWVIDAIKGVIRVE